MSDPVEVYLIEKWIPEKFHNQSYLIKYYNDYIAQHEIYVRADDGGWYTANLWQCWVLVHSMEFGLGQGGSCSGFDAITLETSEFSPVYTYQVKWVASTQTWYLRNKTTGMTRDYFVREKMPTDARKPMVVSEADFAVKQ